MDESFDHQLNSAVGKVCTSWSLIENLLSLFIGRQIRASLMNEVDEKTGLLFETFISNMEFRQKIATAKALAVGLGSKSLSDIEGLLNYIDNDLRIERNRYVHDLWLPHEDGISRIKAGTKVVREQAFSLKAVFKTSKQYANFDEINEFNQKLRDAMEKLIFRIDVYDLALARMSKAKSDEPAREESDC